MMFLWYAYQLDMVANGGTPTRIAVGCVGCVGTNNGLCYFDELLQYVQRAGSQWLSQQTPSSYCSLYHVRAVSLLVKTSFLYKFLGRCSSATVHT
jgi:hypothetical protein